MCVGIGQSGHSQGQAASLGLAGPHLFKRDYPCKAQRARLARASWWCSCQHSLFTCVQHRGHCMAITPEQWAGLCSSLPTTCLVSHRGWRVAEGRLPPAGPSEKQLSFLGSRLCAVPKRQRPGDKQNSGQLQLPPPGPWLQGSVCGCPAGPRAACVQEVSSVGVFE